MLSQLVRRILFALVHWFVNIIFSFRKFYNQLLYIKCRNEDVVKNNDLMMILEHKSKISKLPKHLVVTPDLEHQKISDLARVVIWSLVAGIPYVSFYDTTGELKKNEEKLFSEIEKNKRGIPGCIKWSSKPNLNGFTNGVQAHTVNINIFTCFDGRPTIAQCIQLIAKGKLDFRRESDEFTAAEFNDVLSLMYPSIPDPELVLYSGPLCSTRGLLPWQIRLTEFVQLSLDYSINIENYLGAMYRYNKCDQRFGK